MFKKIIWIFVLLVMTACTIVFSDQADLVKKNSTPIFAELLAPTSGGEAAPVEEEMPLLTDAPIEEVEEVATDTALSSVAKTTAAYSIQSGTPTYLKNFNHPDQGCNWQGVAGQVFGVDGKPVKFLIVKVFGTWNGKEVSEMAVTGMAAGKPYGPGSYEIVMGQKAVNSSTPVYIQLFDSTGAALSDPLQFSTKEKCNKNLVLVNFVKN